MIQRMRNIVTINVEGIDLTTVSDIQVAMEQEETGVEMLFTGGDIVYSNSSIAVTIPKDIGMQLDVAPLKAQIMFTKEGGIPDATYPFTIPVRELIWEDGYGS